MYSKLPPCSSKKPTLVVDNNLCISAKGWDLQSFKKSFDWHDGRLIMVKSLGDVPWNLFNTNLSIRLENDSL